MGTGEVCVTFLDLTVFESGMFDLRCFAFYVQSSVPRYFMFSSLWGGVLHMSVFLLLVPVEVSLLLLSVGQAMERTPWFKQGAVA